MQKWLLLSIDSPKRLNDLYREKNRIRFRQDSNKILKNFPFINKKQNLDTFSNIKDSMELIKKQPIEENKWMQEKEGRSIY